MFFKDNDNWWLWLLLLVIITETLVAFIKIIFGKISPNFEKISLRPEDAYNCNTFCTGGAVGGKPGFPSGHMATTTMFVIMLSLHFANNYILLLGIPWILLMAWSRWSKKCHTWEQIIAGIFTGGLFAYIYEFIF